VSSNAHASGIHLVHRPRGRERKENVCGGVQELGRKRQRAGCPEAMSNGGLVFFYISMGV